MRTGAARGHAGNFHDAGFYASDEEFLALVVPFVTEGVAAGEPVIVGYDARKSDLLRATLRSADAVTFVADGKLYASPAGAIEAYRQQLDRHLAAGAAQIRITGEIALAADSGRFARAGWDRYEAGINAAWGERPVWSRCLYDAATVPDLVLDVVERTHPWLVAPGGGTIANRRYQDVADFEPLPRPADPVEGTTPAFVLTDVSPWHVRRRLAAIADGLLTADALEEMVLAVSEAVENAQLYGLPPTTVTGWTAPGRMVVHVHDTGPGPMNPLAGLVPDRSSYGGRGLWLSHQLTAVEIALHAHPGGFTVRLRSVD